MLDIAVVLYDELELASVDRQPLTFRFMCRRPPARDVREQNPPIVIEIGGHASK
jgi:hypothetical protein